MNGLSMDPHAVHNLIPSAVLTAAAIGFVTARFGARARIRGKLQSSDWVVGGALVRNRFFSLGEYTTLTGNSV